MTRTLLSEAAKGAAGGALATAAMSTVMVAGDRAGLMPDQPPKRIVRSLLPGHRHQPKPGEGLLATVAHFGFGIASGALFGALARRRRARVPLGIAYGLAIWLVSYAGWVPKVAALPPIHRDRPGRPAVMAAGHVVYGTALACALNRWDRRR
ncbi:DUF6789 family protein [Nonomuraea muscovyensis]|uniref:DUF6789 family protein n=1 Tax=Nonomuraea muscovyensis TaxID=1124761 RepID=UPI003402D431|nr:hypothetical protein [Nonomuraea muscovyensis]